MSALSNALQVTKIHRALDARQVRPINDPNFINGIQVGRGGYNWDALAKNLGIHLGPREVRGMMDAARNDRQIFGMDGLEPPVSSPSIVTPIQFLQEWLPGFVEVITAARKIDELVGMVTAGEWHYTQVVQSVKELLGLAQVYGDYTNVPRADWNTNFVTRTIVRFEQGMQVGVLSEAIAAEINVNDGANKRESCALALEIVRNLIGFFGYQSGAGQTYGFLNDPSLAGYTNFANGNWASATFLQITADIRTMFAKLRTQSLDNINPRDIKTTLALATDVVDYMTVTSDFNISVETWLKDNYPMCRVVSAPELDLANGGANVAYLYADKIKDSSTDGGQTFIQIVPAKFKVLGVSKQTKGYEESYSNATTGITVKRPWAVVRFSGN